MTFWIIGGVILLVVILAITGAMAEKKRVAGLTAVAAELGLPFDPLADQGLIDRLASFDLFNQGRSKKTANMIHGDAGDVTLNIFDYKFTTGSGKNSSTWTQSVLLLESAALDLATFAARPEGFFDRVGQAFGAKDIDFDSHPQFSRMFLLRGVDEAAIRTLFRPEVIEYFETRPGMSVEGSGRRLLVYQRNKPIAPDEVRQLMADGLKLHAMWRTESAGGAELAEGGTDG